MTAARRYYLGVLCTAAMLSPHCVRADEDTGLKRKVINDCPGAIRDFQGSELERKRRLIPYLGRVLRLELGSGQPAQVPAILDAPAPGESAGLDIFGFGDPSRSFDPLHEIEAKRCAVRLLNEVPTLSVGAVPDLVWLLSDPKNPQDLDTQSGALLQRILLAGKTSDPAYISDQTIEESAALLNSNSWFYAESVMLEIGPRSIPALLRHISEADHETWSAMERTLLALDESGTAAAPDVIPLLGVADEKARERAARLLGRFSRQSPNTLPELIAKLDDVSENVRAAASSAINVLIDRPEVPIPKDSAGAVATQLLKQMKQSNPNARRELARWLQVRAVELRTLENDLRALYTESDLGLRREILRLLGLLKSPSAETMTFVIKQSLDEEPEIRIAAISALPAFRADIPALVSHLAKLMKRYGGSKLTAEKQATMLAIAAVIPRIETGASGGPLVAPLVELLKLEWLPSPLVGQGAEADTVGQSGAPASPEGLEHYAARALLAIGEPARPALERLAKNQQWLVRMRGTAILARMPGQSPTSEDILIGALNDSRPEIRDDIRGAWTRVTPSALAKVRKRLKSYSKEGKVTAAEFLIAHSLSDTETVQILTNALTDGDCSVKSRRAETIGQAPASGKEGAARELPAAQREAIIRQLTNCFGQQRDLDLRILRIIERFAPLSDQLQTDLVDKITTSSLSNQLTLAIVQNAQALGFSAERIQTVVRHLFTAGDGSLRLPLIRLARQDKLILAQLEPELQRLLADGGADSSLRITAALAIAENDLSKVDLAALLKKELRPDHADLARRSLRDSAIAALPDLLIGLLRDLKNDDDKVPMIAALGDLGARAAGVVDVMLPLLESRSEAVYRETLVALLHIDPANSAVVAALRKALISTTALTLHGERFDARLHPVLDQIAANTQSRTEYLWATRIRNRIQ